MRNNSFYLKIGIVTFSFLLIAVIWLITITRANKNISNPNPVVHFAIENHILILVLLVLISTVYGFLWSGVLYLDIKRRKKTTKGILSTVFMFLSAEERNIIEFLVNSNGATTQAEISRLPGMTRVKAFRSLKKMSDKALLDIVPHGKARRVKLKENIMNALLE